MLLYIDRRMLIEVKRLSIALFLLVHTCKVNSQCSFIPVNYKCATGKAYRKRHRTWKCDAALIVLIAVPLKYCGVSVLLQAKCSCANDKFNLFWSIEEFFRNDEGKPLKPFLAAVVYRRALLFRGYLDDIYFNLIKKVIHLKSSWKPT